MTLELPHHDDARVRLLLHAALAGDDISDGFVDAVLDVALPLQGADDETRLRIFGDAQNCLANAEVSASEGNRDYYLGSAVFHAQRLIRRENEAATRIAAPAIAESPVGSGEQPTSTPLDYHKHREEAVRLAGERESDHATQAEHDAYRRLNLDEAMIHALVYVGDGLRGAR